jgi:hypothetical protein
MPSKYTKKGNNGGARDSAGRKQGQRSSSTLEFRNSAREYTQEAIQFYVGVMRNAEASLSHRMEAANWLCDRGHGKAVIQANMEHEGSVQVTYRTVEEVRVALLEKGIDVQRIPLMIEDFRKQAMGNGHDSDEHSGT